MRISYGKFLQLLEADRIKRVVVYGDMKTAIVEVSTHICIAAVRTQGHENLCMAAQVLIQYSCGMPLPLPYGPQVPHPWYASIMGAPGSYPWLEDSNGKPINLLVPNPEFPDDPT